MRLLFLIVICGITAVGCGGPKPQVSAPQPAKVGPATPVAEPAKVEVKDPGLIVTPDVSLQGKVALVNAKARYVIISYPIGRLPAIDDVLSVYRNGLKVGEIKISGPKRDFNIAGNITKGECVVGDEVREN